MRDLKVTKVKGSREETGREGGREDRTKHTKKYKINIQSRQTLTFCQWQMTADNRVFQIHANIFLFRNASNVSTAVASRSHNVQKMAFCCNTEMFVIKQFKNFLSIFLGKYHRLTLTIDLLFRIFLLASQFPFSHIRHIPLFWQSHQVYTTITNDYNLAEPFFFLTQPTNHIFIDTYKTSQPLCVSCSSQRVCCITTHCYRHSNNGEQKLKLFNFLV